MFLQQLVTGISIGGIYALLATGYSLIYSLLDGTEIKTEWQHKSRSESWTPEMRQQARERTLAQRRKDTK